jgi:TPR repeat protein
LSGRRASTSSAAATKPCWSRPREREASRQAILDAARRLVELHGEAALTLSAVANEAGIARPTIYGYFAGKSELLSQLNGEATSVPEPPREAVPISAAPREDDPKPIPSEPDAPIETDAPRPQDEKAIEAGGENARPSASEDSADYGDMMRLQAEQLDKLAKRIIVPKATTKEGTDGAISRLEARMRVVEQSLTDLEGRRRRDAKELADRIDLAIEAVEQRQKRLETSDSRQLQALAELRLELHNQTSRAKETGLEATSGAAERLEPTVSDETDFQPWKNSPASETAEPNSASPESGQHGYLSSARRAAIDAAAAASQESDRPSKRWTPWHWLLGAAMVAAAGLGFVLNMRSDVAAPVQVASQLVAHNNRQPPNRPAEKPSVTALAAAGNAEAQLILGLKLLNGAGVAMNIEKAAGWLERAAIRGQPIAQETIGVLYQTGTGVVADMSKAIRWYEAAARQGNVKAMANLGKVHAGGSSEGTDFAKAAQWFARAAGFGDVDAQFDLAVLYERGDGVPRSPADAYRWYAIAAAQGDHDAPARADLVAEQLSPDKLQAAKRAAADFKPNPASRAANDIPSLAASDATNATK